MRTFRTRASGVIELHNTVLLERPKGPLTDATLPPGMHHVERFVDDVALISRLDREHGRRGDPARIRRRFEHGFRHFAIQDGDACVAWAWAVHAHPRYFDELRWCIALADDQVWLRDAFVIPSHRGRRLLVALLDSAAKLESREFQFFSDVYAVNLPSLRAHAALGFRRLCTVHGIAWRERWIWRQRPPACIPQPTAIRPERRLLRLTDAELRWHRAHVA